MKRPLVLAGLILLASLPVFAQEEAPAEAPPEPWKGALGLSYVDTSGNPFLSTSINPRISFPRCTRETRHSSSARALAVNSIC